MRFFIDAQLQLQPSLELKLMNPLIIDDLTNNSESKPELDQCTYFP